MKLRSILPQSTALRRIISLLVIAIVTAIIFLILRHNAPTEPIEAEELPILLMTWMLDCEDYFKWGLSLSKAIFKGLPLWLFLCLFGPLVYSDWTADQVYVICRLKSRKNRYLKRCLHLFLYACVAATIYTVELFVFLSPQLKALTASVLVSSVVRVWISVVGICFSFALLQSLISLLYGSSIGFLSSSAIWCLSLLLVPTYLYWCAPNRAWHSITSVYTSVFLGLSQIASIGWLCTGIALHCAILTVIGMALVKRCDLGLKDQDAV